MKRAVLNRFAWSLACAAFIGCGGGSALSLDGGGGIAADGAGPADALRRADSSVSSVPAQESHACSTDPADDPQLVCTPTQDLVCIATNSVQIANPEVASKYDGGVRAVYVCRLPCSTTAECPPGDVCCAGVIYGKTYGKMRACVPPAVCETAGGAPRDGGVGQ